MDLIGLIFFVVASIALLVLPRKWAPVPLLVSCCYMTLGQGIVLGPFSLPVYRMVLTVGIVRVFVRNERLEGRINAIDLMVVAWAAWVFFASFFHEWEPGSGPVFAS